MGFRRIRDIRADFDDALGVPPALESGPIPRDSVLYRIDDRLHATGLGNWRNHRRDLVRLYRPEANVAIRHPGVLDYNRLHRVSVELGFIHRFAFRGWTRHR